MTDTQPYFPPEIIAGNLAMQPRLDRYFELKQQCSEQVQHVIDQIQVWQHQRLRHAHAALLSQPAYQSTAEFFFNYLYDHQQLDMLANQLHLALEQRIKLSRWLPKEVVETIELGFDLALHTLELDQQVAEYLISYNMPCAEQEMMTALHALNQFQARHQQLVMLKQTGIRFAHYAQSFIIYSAFRFAKSPAERRGFMPLYDYVQHGLKAMHRGKHASRFFKQLVDNDSKLLNHYQHHPEQGFEIIIDAQHQLVLPTASTLD